MASVNTSLDELDTYIAAGVANMQFAWLLPKQTTLEFGIRLMGYGILAGGFHLNIFYFHLHEKGLGRAQMLCYSSLLRAMGLNNVYIGLIKYASRCVACYDALSAAESAT